MSKIYQALEKAEKERQREERKDWLPVPGPAGVPQPEPPGELKVDEKVQPKALLSSFFEPSSLAAEQFRKLRSYIRRIPAPQMPKTIMVTSAMNGEGKTFVAANLAAGFADDFHTHCLLVDCDLRNPSLSKWFGYSEETGLSDYLAEDRNVSDVIGGTGLEKLRILPAGKIRENPTELIGSRKMAALVDELKSRYDDRYIIFDSTPLLATTEPEVLGKLVDGIIVVVRAGVTPRETVRQGIRSLDSGKIIGVVLNDLNFRTSALYSRYFGAGGYYYRYGYGRKKPEPGRNGRWKGLLHWGRRSEKKTE